MHAIKQILFGAFCLGCLLPAITLADDEIALYDGGGTAVAYIAVNDEFTIYSWGGQPVAYLEAQDAGKFAVYGFNGHHLGWFYQSVIWDHEGNGSCAVKARLQYSQAEPFKGFKQFKPFKGFKAYAPFEPTFSNKFGGTPCSLLLASGRG